MRIDLAGRNALVTGGAAGLGRASARALAESGARVAVVDINLAGAQETAADLREGLALRCDVSDPADVTSVCGQVASTLGGVDILVNCAGIIAYRRGIGGFPTEEWDRVLDVNLRGTYLTCRALIDGMKARRWGRIVNFSSLAARVGGIEVGVHYAASKAGLIGLTRTLAKEAGPFGITANVVAPGIIATDPVIAQIGGHEQDYVAQIPLRRIGQPADVAGVVLFLASPLAEYLTGLVIDINGGMYMG